MGVDSVSGIRAARETGRWAHVALSSREHQEGLHMSTRVRWALVVIVGCLGASSLLFGQAAMQNTPTTPLPAAKDVIARYVTAIGGATAQKKITSLRMRGHLEMAAQGMSGDVEVSMARPAKSITRSEITGIGRIEEGFNGTIGWEVNPITGPQQAAGKKLSEMRDDAQFDSALHLPDSVKEMTTIGREEFDGHSAVKLKVVFISGNEQIEYYDSATGFQIGGELTRE